MVKKSTVIAVIISFFCGMLSCGAITARYYTRKLNDYRLEYRSLTEKLERAVGETEQIRTEIARCRAIVDDSRVKVQEIRNASDRIREQVKILQDYYDNTSFIISNFTDNEYTEEY